MTDPAGQYDPYAKPPPSWGAPPTDQGTQGGQPGYGAPPAPIPPTPGGAPSGRYTPPSLDEIWYKPTMNMLLFAVTCGLWGAAWSYRTHDDLQKHNGDGLGGTVGLVLGLFVMIAIGFTVPMELEKAYQRNGWPSPVKTTDGLWLLIPLAGPFIWYPKIQAALNSYWVSQGSPPPTAS